MWFGFGDVGVLLLIVLGRLIDSICGRRADLD